MREEIEIRISPGIRLNKVSRYQYGQFAEHLGRCIYEGIWVGEGSKIENEGGIRLDVAEALKKLRIPALRWPGGCFADCYHWRDGVGPRSSRPRRLNIPWDEVESNEFGTDEFMRLCRMLETEPYICLNVGSGTVEEALGWIEYCNSRRTTTLAKLRAENGHEEPYDVKFWAVGNENWGCGGAMTPEFYADLYKRIAVSARRMAGDEVKLAACGSGGNQSDWDERLLHALRDGLDLVDYIAIHKYVGGFSSDVHFNDADYYTLIATIDEIEEYTERVSSLAEAYSRGGHQVGVVLDEWGTWYREAKVQNGLQQQNTLRDALFAAAAFHCFHGCERLFMTNMAQTVNVLQSLIRTRGPKMTVTPTYWVYEMYQPHQNGQIVAYDVDTPVLSAPAEEERDAISMSATISDDGLALFVSIVNFDLENDYEASIQLVSDSSWKVRRVRRLTSENVRDRNTFKEPDRVKPEEGQVKTEGRRNIVRLPAKSITTVLLEMVE